MITKRGNALRIQAQASISALQDIIIGIIDITKTVSLPLSGVHGSLDSLAL